jgi:hypothetical protein
MEIAAGRRVLGAHAIRWNEVRVATGGWLRPVFVANRGRAFVTFHTVNVPGNAPGVDGLATPLATMVHELVHVLQYERVGSVYIPQALAAQFGAEGYDYGGAEGLAAARRAGKRLAWFNREQQAQIAEDYFRFVVEGDGAFLSLDERGAYEHYIRELRARMI